MSYQEHYAQLFDHLQTDYGRLDAETIVAIVGFAEGGSVNLSTQGKSSLFVTCELSVYPEQQKSAEGLKFELFTASDFNEEQASAILTALGNLSMVAQLGDGHTADVSICEIAGVRVVSMQLHSRTVIDGTDYGLYRVRPN